MENKFKQIDDDSVVSLATCMLKISYLLSFISAFLQGQGWENIRNNLHSAGSGLMPNVGRGLLNQGVYCEVLKPGKSWQKGKLKMKISFEFQPDESEIEATPEENTSESSLDDIRRKLNQVN